MSFKDLREALLLSYEENIISDEEFLLLYDEYSSKNPEFQYSDYERFDLEKLGDAECKANFRIEKRDLPALAEALRIPGAYKTNQRSIAGGMEGLYMLLKRFAYPCRYGDMIPLFGRAVPVICMITPNHVLVFIYNNHSMLITEWNSKFMPMLFTKKEPLRRIVLDPLKVLFVP